MSIFESIQVAEKKAEQIRLNANDEVNLLLEKTRIESEEKAKAMYAEASSEEQNIYNSIDNKIRDKANEITAMYEEKEEALEKQVESRMNHALDFIMEKVFEL
ncbi:MAG: hypothetical protein PHX62_05680 [Bacilli bacterium]|nr:hypothetical protein [Bacilli bacterium]